MHRVRQTHWRVWRLALISTLIVVSDISVDNSSARAVAKENRLQGLDKLCDDLPTGNATGIRRACGDELGSNGVARGDFNGDGFGDLAIGVPLDDETGGDDAGAVNVIYGSSDGLLSAGSSLVRAAQLWSQASPGVQNSPEADDEFGAALAAGDFNGDGCSDLAIGVPGEDYESITEHPIVSRVMNDAGLVNVIYGSDNGLVGNGASQGGGFMDVRCKNSGGVPFPQVFQFTDLSVFTDPAVEPLYRFLPGAGDSFGAALSWGDYNADGYGDLAIGIPGWDVQQDSMDCHPILNDAGAVAILYGASGLGLRAGGNRLDDEFWTQHGQAFRMGGDESLSFFCPNEDTDFTEDSFLTFIDPARDLIQSEVDLPPGVAGLDILGAPEPYDRFGSALASGDFDGNGDSDIAIGVRGEDVGGATNAGAVNVIYFAGFGGNQFWSQGEGLQGGVEDFDHFGQSMAVGDFNGDGRDDLAVGVPDEDVGSPRQEDAGAVNIIYSSTNGLTSAGDQILTENDIFGSGSAQAGARFGFALAAGNFNGDSVEDLAIGAPFRDVVLAGGVQSARDAGHVVVVFSGPSIGAACTAANPCRLRPNVNQRIVEGGTLTGQTVVGAPQRDDNFGSALTAWDFNGVITDLAIGIPGQDITNPNTGSTSVDTGEVLVLNGSGAGVGGFVQKLFSQATVGVPGSAGAGDRFGAALY